jgi:hypothetical protein
LLGVLTFLHSFLAICLLFAAISVVKPVGLASFAAVGDGKRHLDNFFVKLEENQLTHFGFTDTSRPPFSKSKITI